MIYFIHFSGFLLNFVNSNYCMTPTIPAKNNEEINKVTLFCILAVYSPSNFCWLYDIYFIFLYVLLFYQVFAYILQRVIYLLCLHEVILIQHSSSGDILLEPQGYL